MKADSSTVKGRIYSCLVLAIIGIILAFIVGLSTIPQAQEFAISSKACLHAFRIVQGMEKYATDHQGHYPSDTSSTAIFQTLLDDHYVDNSEIFYFPMSGKSKAITNQLRPENVCWDVINGVDSASPDNIPLVFSTGYKITFVAGANAEPRNPPPLLFTKEIAFCTKGDSASTLPASANGSVPNFIPADFDPKGKTYHQLTPDGELLR